MAFVTGPSRLEIAEVELPAIGEYDVLVKVEYGTICTGSDLHLFSGDFALPWDYPFVLGHESVGTVVQLGSRVRSFQEGDLVTRVGVPAGPGYHVRWGGFAEYGTARDHWAMREDGVPAVHWIDHRVNQRVPEAISAQDATMIVTWRETLSYLTRMGVTTGSSLLIVGSGGTALAFAAHAHNLGAGRICMVGSANRAEQAHRLGVTEFYDYKNVRLGDIAPGFSHIVDAVGQRNSLDQFLPLVAVDGTVAIYGADALARMSVDPTRAVGSFKYYSGGYDESEVHDLVIDMMLEGRLKPECWVDVNEPWDLGGLGDALAHVGRRKAVKALIRL